MSYDLLVWEGERPATDALAAEQVELIMNRIDAGEPPTERIRRYVGDLLYQWPDDDAHSDDAPWAAGPLINEASGPAIHIAIVPSRAEEVAAAAADVADRHGLQCYDLQLATRRPLEAEPGEDAPPRNVGEWLTWLRRTIFG